MVRCTIRVQLGTAGASNLRKIHDAFLAGRSELTLQRIAEQQGYRIQRKDDRYTLIHDRINAGMSHFQDVPLEVIARFFGRPLPPSRN